MKKIKENKQALIIILAFVLGVFFSLIIMNVYLSKIGILNRHNNTTIYEKTSLKPAIDKIYDAVVSIQGYSYDQETNGGTGFIYKVDNMYAYILTNEHVISSEAEYKVVFSDQKTTTPDILGKDEYIDLAVLRVNKKYAKQVANIGKSDNTNLGDTVFVVGTPVGTTYQGSITAGILSGKDRIATTTVPTKKNNQNWVVKVLQVDASINPGNSGGPLLNANGEVIGVVSHKLVDEEIEGMGFAIPIEYAMSQVDLLEEGKKVQWPVIGIGMIDVDDQSGQIQNDVKPPKNINEGVIVTEIKKDTGAEKSDLKKGDTITEINGIPVKNVEHLRYEAYKHKAGETIEVTYYRKNIKRKTKIKLSSN